jgi:hypothetical protein
VQGYFTIENAEKLPSTVGQFPVLNDIPILADLVRVGTRLETDAVDVSNDGGPR